MVYRPQKGGRTKTYDAYCTQPKRRQLVSWLLSLNSTKNGSVHLPHFITSLHTHAVCSMCIFVSGGQAITPPVLDEHLVGQSLH